nr:WxL domain-containing protein [Enterococcus ureasiticus]
MKSIRNVIGLFILILSFTGIVSLKNPEKAEAAILESNITVSLYGNGTASDSKFTLQVDDSNNVAKLFFTPGNSSAVFHKDYAGKQYYNISVFPQASTTSRFTSVNNGDSLQSKLVTDINGKQIQYGDTLRITLAEPEKQRVSNANGTSFGSVPSDFINMYYLMTPGGFVPVNDAIAFRTFDNANGVSNGNGVGFQFTGIFANQAIVSSLASNSSELRSDGFAMDFGPITTADNWKFHNQLSDSSDEYASLSKFVVSSEHKLVDSSGSSVAKAQPSTTIGNFNSQIMPNKTNAKGPLSAYYGQIYRVYSKDPKRVLKFNRIWYKQASNSETYYEYTAGPASNTASSNLNELDFNKVTAKNVTLELGSDTSKQPVTNFSTVSSYSKLSSSFGGTLKSDTLGSYDLPITVRQPLITNNNYLTSSVTSKVTVVDTTKPTGTVKSNLSVAVNGTLALKDMFSTVTDNSGTTNLKYSYVGNALDTTTSGKQTVTVRITDPSGNYTDYSVPVEVTPGNFGLLSSDTLNFGTIKSGVTTKNVELGTNQTVGISMEDQRGTKTGWRIQAKTSTFTPKSTTTGKVFTAGIKMPKGTVKSNGTSSTDLTTFDVTLNSSLQNVISAPSGKGMNSWTYTLGTTSNPVSLVNIPTTVYVGDYQATLTWSMINAPS